MLCLSWRGLGYPHAITTRATSAEATNSFVQTLGTDSNVVVAVTDENGQTICAPFLLGLQCLYEVIEEDADGLSLPAVQNDLESPVTASGGRAIGGPVRGGTDELGLIRSAFETPGKPV